MGGGAKGEFRSISARLVTEKYQTSCETTIHGYIYSLLSTLRLKCASLRSAQRLKEELVAAVEKGAETTYQHEIKKLSSNVVTLQLKVTSVEGENQALKARLRSAENDKVKAERELEDERACNAR